MRGFLVGSLVVHTAAFAAVVRLQPHARDNVPRVVSLELIAPTPTPTPPTAPSTPQVAPPVTKPPRNRSASTPRSASPAPPASPSPPASPPPLAPPATDPPASTGGLLSPRRTGVDLTWRGTPSAAPLGDSDAPASVATVGPRRAWHPKGTAGDPILGKLDEVPDDPYPLIKKKDGWVYKGAGFAAKIHRDGSVTFDDKVIGFDKGIFSFDLTDAIMRAKKQDPYRREKEKFLAHTRALREKLLDEARAFREGTLAPTSDR